MSGCGETSERVAAIVHGAVATLYLVMLIFHVKSVLVHEARRADEASRVIREDLWHGSG